jgi:hypothetical protein
MMDLSQVKWTNAKTYQDAPHEYILSWDYPEVFLFYRQLIRREGVRQKFTLRGRTYPYRYYYAEDGWKYWVIQDVLNRARANPEAKFKDDPGGPVFTITVWR